MLEAGSYEFRLMKNSHEQVLDSIVASIGSDIRIEKDPATGTEVVNKFDDMSGHIQKYLSRADWAGTFPTTPTASDREVDQSFISFAPLQGE